MHPCFLPAPASRLRSGEPGLSPPGSTRGWCTAWGAHPSSWGPHVPQGLLPCQWGSHPAVGQKGLPVDTRQEEMTERQLRDGIVHPKLRMSAPRTLIGCTGCRINRLFLRAVLGLQKNEWQVEGPRRLPLPHSLVWPYYSHHASVGHVYHA